MDGWKDGQMAKGRDCEMDLLELTNNCRNRGIDVVIDQLLQGSQSSNTQLAKTFTQVISNHPSFSQ